MDGLERRRVPRAELDAVCGERLGDAARAAEERECDAPVIVKTAIPRLASPRDFTETLHAEQGLTMPRGYVQFVFIDGRA